MVVWPRDSGEERTGRVGLHLEVELTGLGGIRSGVLGQGIVPASCFFYLNIWVDGMCHLLLDCGTCWGLGWAKGGEQVFEGKLNLL